MLETISLFMLLRLERLNQDLQMLMFRYRQNRCTWRIVFRLQIHWILTVILCIQLCSWKLSYFVWYLNLRPITLAVLLLLLSPIYGATNQLFVRPLCKSVISVNQLIYLPAFYHKSSDSGIQELFLFTIRSSGANLLFCNYRGPDIVILTPKNKWEFH